MEMDKVRELLIGVGLDHSVENPSPELRAIRSIALALLHMAEAIQDVQQRLQIRR
jgi:hypothetical protein